MRVKEESEKAGLKLNTEKTKIMASGPITSWHIEREKVEAVTNFIFLGSKITADGNGRHEYKRHLLHGRKAMTNLQSIFKSINSLALNLLYGPTLTSIYDYWKNHSFDYTDLCWQSDISAF